MQNQLTFQAASSSTGEIYTITVKRDGSNLTCRCTCAAGQNGTACKHRLGVLRADPSGLVGGDLDRLVQVPAMLRGTDVDDALSRVSHLEAEQEQLKRRLRDAKKALARSLDN